MVGTGLPRELSTFVGREDHVRRGRALLATHRLVTLSGPGGCGKTRLALRVASGAAGTARWVELAACHDPVELWVALARAVGLPVAGAAGAAGADLVAAHLEGAHTLLVLDNCEHLCAAAAALTDTLLRAVEDLRVLTTSREPLGVEGEVVWRVPPLHVPPDGADAAVVEGCEAVRLFRARTAAVAPEGVEAPAETVADICRALDGMPLAVELAAARTATLSPSTIRSQLDDRFRLLTGGPRPAPDRLRSLRASIRWSHDLCADGERVLLRRLAVFAGDFEAGAAERVTGFGRLAGADVAPTLDALVTKSLVQMRAPHDGPARYRLLESIRVYARERVDEAGEGVTVADRHLTWLAGLAEELEPATSRCSVDALDRLEREAANLRRALDHAAGSASASASASADGLRLVSALAFFWARRGYGIAGIELGERAVDAAGGAGVPVGLRARARWAIGYARLYGGTFAEAGEAAASALADAALVGDGVLAARAHLVLGMLTMFSDPAAGRALFDLASSAAHGSGDSWCEYEALGAAAFTHFVQHRPVAARAADEHLVALDDGQGPFQEAWDQLRVGMAAQLDGRFDEARRGYRAAAAAAARIRDPLLQFYAHSGLVNVALAGDPGELVVVAAAMNRPELRFAPVTLDFAAALRAVTAPGTDALSVARTLVAAGAAVTALSPFEGPRMLLAGGAYALAGGDVDTAADAGARALAHARTVGSALAGAARLLLARVARCRGDDPGAVERLAHDALTDVVDAGLRGDLPDALTVLGGVAVDAGRTTEGLRLLGAAATLWEATDRVDVLAATAAADRDRARLALGADADAVAAEGAAMDAATAVAYARRARGPRGRPRSGWESLTPTEREVVALVVDGASNPAIAARLLISRATVKTHLLHVFAKLAVSSRAELAARAARRALS